MKNSSKELLLQLAAEHGLMVMGHNNHKTKWLPKIYTSENSKELNFPKAPVFLVKKDVVTKKFLGIPRKINAYTICSIFIESHRVQAYVYGEQYKEDIENITNTFSQKVCKTGNVLVETNNNPGLEYFFPKRRIKNGEGYLGSEYLRISTSPRWPSILIVVGLIAWVACIYFGLSTFLQNLSLLVFVAGFVCDLFFGLYNRTTIYRTTADHFKSAVVRKQLIDLEPIGDAIDKYGSVKGYD